MRYKPIADIQILSLLAGGEVDVEALRQFRDRFHLPLSDDDVGAAVGHRQAHPRLA